MFSVEKLPLLIEVNLIQLMEPGGMHRFPSLLSSLLYLATCKLTPQIPAMSTCALAIGHF